MPTAAFFFAEYASESNGFGCLDGYTGEANVNWPCLADPLCIGKPKSGHGRGMCQWGSQRWATGVSGSSGTVVRTPRPWHCILDHYYNDSGNTNGAGIGLRKAFLPLGAGHEIAYSAYSKQHIDCGIFKMNSNGTKQTRLTTTGKMDFPVWSPDGTKIAYSDYKSLARGLFVMNADGSNQTRLTTDSSESSIYDLVWSPDSNRLAFSLSPGINQAPLIYLINVDGSNKIRLTNGSVQERNPSWSPDGNSLVFCSMFVSNYQIFKMDMNNSITQLTFDQSIYASSFSPAFSPNNQKIAFTNYDYNSMNNSYNPNLHLMNADGSNDITLTQFYYVENLPNCWSPDGNNILVSVWQSPQVSNIFVVTPGTVGPPVLSQLANGSYPIWSADGQRIAFQNGNIFIMNSNGSGLLQLTNYTYMNRNFSWAKCLPLNK